MKSLSIYTQTTIEKKTTGGKRTAQMLAKISKKTDITLVKIN